MTEDHVMERNDELLSKSSLDPKTKGILRNYGYTKVSDLKNLSRVRFVASIGKKIIYLEQLEHYLGRPLSDAQFESIEGKDFIDRWQRLTIWYLAN